MEFDTTGMVRKYYQMNPETEDLIPNGTLLRDGMVVLVEDPNKRMDMRHADLFVDWQIARALENNRWCTVSQVQLLRNDLKELYVSFVATYEDGTKQQRKYHYTHAWMVKKDSVRDTTKKMADASDRITDLIMDARRRDRKLREETRSQDEQYDKIHDLVIKAALSDWSDKSGSQAFEDYCGDITQTIIDIFKGRS